MAAPIALRGVGLRSRDRGVSLIRPSDREVVLLDLGMPSMDGYEAPRITGLTRVDAMRIALTGWREDQDRRRARAAGFDHHLVQPADYRPLVDLVIRLPPRTGAA